MDTANKYMNEMPNKYNSYEAYDKMRDNLKNYVKMNKIIENLKTEAIEPRHWEIILKKMKVKKKFIFFLQ